MIEIAGEEERLKNQGVQQTIQAPQATQAQPGIGKQFTDMATQRAMTGVLDAGSNAIAGKAAEAGLAGSGAMAGAGAAMPYVGMGLLAGKALGFFNNGGHVGPLYAEQGQQVQAPMSLKDALTRQLMEEYEFAAPIYKMGVEGQTPRQIADHQAQMDSIKKVYKQYPELMQRAMNYKAEGGSIGPLYAAQGDQAEDDGMLETIARKLKSAKNYVMGEDRQGSDASSFLKGEGVQYNAMGGMMGPLASVKYKSQGGEIEYKYK